MSPSVTAGLVATLGGAETVAGFCLPAAFADDVAVVGAPLDPDAFTASGPFGVLPGASFDAGAVFCIVDALLSRRLCAVESFRVV